MKSDTLRTLPLEASRFLNDEHVAKMNCGQRGLYISMLCWQWDQGDLPDDAGELAFHLRLDAREVAKALPVVRQRFHQRENGRLYNERLESSRVEALQRLAKWRESGSRGGRSRIERSDRSNNGEEPEGSLQGCLESPFEAPLKSTSTIQVKSSQVYSSNNSKAGGTDAVADEITKRLTSEGIARHVAVELVSEFGPEVVRQQLDWHRSRRRLKDRTASLVTAIREGWPKPRHQVSLGADLLNDPRFGPSPSDNIPVAN